MTRPHTIADAGEATSRPPGQRDRAIEHLSALRGALETFGLDAPLASDSDGRPCLRVSDADGRTRRVYVHLAFFWFYWGDQRSERASLMRPGDAATAISEAAACGWPDAPQGDLRVSMAGVDG